jgi:hypothetical protein
VEFVDVYLEVGGVFMCVCVCVCVEGVGEVFKNRIMQRRGCGWRTFGAVECYVGQGRDECCR